MQRSRRTELRAVTGPDYGRIHDHEIVEAVQRIADNVIGDTLRRRLTEALRKQFNAFFFGEFQTGGGCRCFNTSGQ